MVNQDKSLNSVEVPVTKLGNKKETFLHIHTAATELFHVKCKKEGKKIKFKVEFRMLIENDFFSYSLIYIIELVCEKYFTLLFMSKNL